MFDTMTMTKIVGALCGALLIFLLGNMAAESLYHSGAGGHGEEHALAYDIAPDAGHADTEAPEEGPDFAAVLASADVAKGEKVFGKCKACHKLEDGANGTGPHLYGVVGRDVAAVDGFSYSSAMAEMEGAWTPEQLNAFLENPKGVVPGTKMTFSGLKKIDDRANVVAFLASVSGTPIEMAAPTEETEAMTEEAAPAEEMAPEQEAAAEQPAEMAQEQPTEQAAAEPTQEPAAEPEAEAPAETTAAAVVAGDAAEGEKVFKKCKACHKVEDGKNGVGPYLYRVIGRDIGSVEGYKYSATMSELPGTWTPETVDQFLANPRGFAKGTKMTFAGLKSAEDRANVIAYLETLGN